MNNELKNPEEVEKWLKRIAKAEEKYSSYQNLVKKNRDRYKNAKTTNEQNIYWSSVETLKPFLYFKPPKPYVEEKDKKGDVIVSTAASILEKALSWDLEQFNFDDAIKHTRDDFLIGGLGLAWEQYSVETEAIATDVGFEEVKKNEKIITSYFSPLDFLADSEKVNVWEDVTWIAKRTHLTKNEVVENFGKKIAVEFPNYMDKDEDKKDTVVYEIWDKTSRKILFVCKDIKRQFLKIQDDYLNLKDFFPMPKPIFSTLANDGIIPTPDFQMVEKSFEELNSIISRMRSLTKSIKVTGAYDKANSEIRNILDKDMELVGVSDFAKLQQKGGLKNIVDFMPIQQYVDSLTTLAQRKAEVLQEIYEVTGISDIMRGNSDPNETATAVTKKTNFGTLRNQDRQNDMQRFLKDLFEIKAQIICNLFSADKLAEFIPDNIQDESIIASAIQLLKQNGTRDLILDVETDISYNQSDETEQILNCVTTINDMVTKAMLPISQQPLLLDLYREMVKSVVSSLPKARQFEQTIDKTFEQIKQELSQPQEPTPNPEEQRIMIEKQKADNDYEIKKGQLQLKTDELALKNRIEETKNILTNKEMDIQKEIKDKELAMKEFPSANITTGYVGGF